MKGVSQLAGRQGKIESRYPHKNKSRPARMVLLENFGAEPLTVEVGRSNGGKFVCLLPRKVI